MADVKIIVTPMFGSFSFRQVMSSTSFVHSSRPPVSWKTSFWLVYGLVLFGSSTLFSTLMGTAAVLLLVGPICGLALLTSILAWIGVLPRTAHGNTARVVVKSATRAFLFSLLPLSVLIAGSVFVQPHIFKDLIEDPARPFAIWPATPPSALGIAAFLIVLVVGLVLPARFAMERAWKSLYQADTARGTAAVRYSYTRSVVGRLAVTVLTIAALFGGLLVLHDGPGWRNWAWPVGGTLKSIKKVTNLWNYYDRTKPWSIGGVRYLIPADWQVEIITASSNVGRYQVIALTPLLKSESLPVDRVYIHNRLADFITLAPDVANGDYRCKRRWRFGLTACWHRSRPADQLIDTADYDYAASLRTSIDIGYDPSVGGGLSPDAARAAYRESLYFLSDDAGTDFLARCRQSVCTWAFVDRQTEAQRSTVEVVFRNANIERWNDIRQRMKENLSRFKVK